jgi:tetratricopeptide (TPR) repeat protein
MRKTILIAIGLVIALVIQSKAQEKPNDIGKQYFEMGDYFRWANAINGNGDHVKALVSYQKSAALKYPDGIAAVGEMTLKGFGGLHKDEKKAFELFKKAYEMGSGRACYNLAKSYAYGIACEVDYEKMIAYLNEGIKRGDRLSLYGMGDMLYKGWGIEQSYEKAITYFEKAAAMGCASSKYYLGLCYRNGYGVAKNEQKGKEYLQKAAKVNRYANKEIKKAKPETETAKKIKNKEFDTPQSYNKVKHNTKVESLKGEWTGHLSFYDWSGKFKLDEQEVMLTITTNGDQIEGTWTQKGATFAIKGFNNQFGIVFNSGEFDCVDHYVGKVRLKINTGSFEAFKQGGKTVLAGNISLFSITEKAPERPAYIVLSKKNKEEPKLKTAIIPEAQVVNNQNQPTQETVLASTKTQSLPEAQAKQQPVQAPIIIQVQDNAINSRVWPNPFNNRLSIEYNLKTGCETEVRLISIGGMLISVLAKEQRMAGLQTQHFDVSVPNGTYVIQILTDNMKASHIIIKQ